MTNACLLFDCDGTLVDSERLCNIGLVRMFRPLGVTLDVDELVIRFRGWKLATILQTLQHEHALVLAEEFVSAYREIVSQLFEANLKPVEGIVHALENLPQPKAVVSSGPPHKIRQALKICGLCDFFGDNIYSSYDVGIWKPDPGIYLHAAAGMGFPAERCVVIEDGPVGVEAGYLAGMATYFYNRFDEPYQFPGVVSFDSMYSLPELLTAKREQRIF